MKLTHAADDGLAGIGIGVNFEGRVFLRQLIERDAHLFLVAFGFRFNRNRDDRLSKFDRLQLDRMFFRADRVASRDVLQPNAGTDIASINLADLLALVSVHLEQASDALGAPLSGAEHAVAGLQMSRVDADKCKLTNKRISHYLEGQRGKRLIVVNLALQNLLWIVRIGTFGGRNIERRGQKIDHCIE